MDSGLFDVPAPGAIVGGKYRVRHTVGQGGVGVVLAAEALASGASCAVKLMLPAKAADAVLRRRFLREARAARSLTSEHVARVLDVGTDEQGRPFYVMELLDGVSLERLLGERGRLGAAEAADYMLEACEGLAEAHARGIVHRDIKPSNLHLARGPGGARLIKVLDFGIAKIDPSQIGTKGALTDERELLGSPAYMAPEQLRNARGVDGRADIWALGMVLHELVAGRRPFEARGLAELVSKVLTAEPVPLRAHRQDAPAALEALVLRCLEKEPGRRFQDLAELAQALAPLGSEGGAAGARRVEQTLGVAPKRASQRPPKRMRATLADSPIALARRHGTGTIVLDDEDARETIVRGPRK